MAAELLQAGGGVSVLTRGTDVHLVLCDLRESALDGKQAEDRLAAVGITVNRNAVPFDPRPPAVSSGLRVGTPALASRACSAGASRTWIQIIIERPGGPAPCPETSSSPWPRKNTSPGSSGGPNSR